MDDESTVVDTASLQLIVLGHLIQQEFSRLISLSEFLEGELNEEMDRRRVDAESLRGIGTEEEQGFNSVAIDDNLFEVERDFPRIVRYSLLMT